VPDASHDERLAAIRPFVVVVRFVVEASGRVLYGEVVDSLTGTAHRFVGLQGLSAAIGSWLKEAIRKPAPDGGPRSESSDTERTEPNLMTDLNDE
jgi:hypothetical protein